MNLFHFFICLRRLSLSLTIFSLRHFPVATHPSTVAQSPLIAT